VGGAFQQIEEGIPFATTTSILPNFSADFSTQASMADWSPISTLDPMARAPSAASNAANSSPRVFRAQYETFAPSERNVSTMALPIPLVPPEEKVEYVSGARGRYPTHHTRAEMKARTGYKDMASGELSRKPRHFRRRFCDKVSIGSCCKYSSNG
jgi:hypothetical protein